MGDLAVGEEVEQGKRLQAGLFLRQRQRSATVNAAQISHCATSKPIPAISVERLVRFMEK
ncbi:hypothetical protein [Serratia sp. NA_13]|uniref:hypothetical protein n=1 Tax=Serratia sp. NA_13 TaxID=3415658 RepID=UPI004046AA4D